MTAASKRNRFEVAETAVDQYMKHLRIRNLREQSIYNVSCALTRLRRWAGEPVLLLTHDRLIEWQSERCVELTPEGRRTELSQVRNFYRWSVDEGLIRDDPSRRVPFPRVSRGLPRPIADESVSRAIGEADDDVAVILGLAAFAGLRAHEIAGLTWSAVALDDKYPTLRVYDGKGGHGRIVPVSHTLGTLLRGLEHRSGPIIKRRDGGKGACKPHRISSMANDHLHSLGIRDSLHQLRHRFATMTYQASRDIRAVQDLLGHASPTTTSRYAAVASGVAINAVESAGTLR